MPEESRLLELEKFIGARLWHTTLVVLDLNSVRDEHLLFLPRHLVETITTWTKSEKQQWMGYKLMLQLDKETSNEIIEKCYVLEFQTSLKSVDDSLLSSGVVEELTELIQHGKHDDDCIWTRKISATCCRFLESSLLNHPSSTCCWLIPSNYIFLYDTYANVLEKLTRKDDCDKNLGALLCILSKMSLPDSKEDLFLTWFYPRIFKVIHESDFLLALYCRKSNKFLRWWNEFVDSEARNYIYQNDTDKKTYVKKLVLTVTHKSLHWLFDVLSTCSELINKGEYEKTCRILSCPLAQNLWSSLLLYHLQNLPHVRVCTSDAETWQKNFSMCKALKFLSEKCRYSQYEHHVETFNSLDVMNDRLNSQLAIVEWILHRRQKCASNVTDQNLSVQRILEGLREHCSLDVLKRFVNFNEWDDGSEITSLLRQDTLESVQVFTSYRCMQLALKVISSSSPESLTEIDCLLNEIADLNLRLELIENIFSLIFLRHEAHFGLVEAKFGNENEENDDVEEEGYETSSVTDKSHHSHQHQQYGFVCDNIVKFLLNHSRRSLVQLGVDFAKLRRERSSDDEELETLQRRIIRMDGALDDAFWRLELIQANNPLQIDGEKPIISRLRSRSIFYNEPRNDSSNDEEVVSSETSWNNDNDDNNGYCCNSRRQNNKKDPRIKSSSHPKERIKKNVKLVELMLSPKESLVLQCLWRADYARAQEVIEMFDMKNTQLDGHVRLSKAMHQFRNEAMKQSSSFDTADSTARHKEIQILENIRRAAQGGYENSRLANQLETFLSSQETNARLVAGETMTAREVLALCALDLGLTVTVQTRNSLLEVAVRYARSTLKLHHHLDDVQWLVTDQNVGEAQLAVANLLCDGTIPLAMQYRRKRTDFWQRLLDDTRLFWTTRSTPSAADVDKQKLLVDIDSLVCNSNSIRNQQQQGYLHRIIAHMEILMSIVPNDGQVEVESFQTLLNNSLNSYFGRQIFDLKVEPESLEAIANKLGIDLVHSVVLYCCPKLACLDSLGNVVPGRDSWGCVILNENNASGNVAQCEDPNECVASILERVLQVIQRSCCNESRILNQDLSRFSEDGEIRKILGETTNLESLDLSILSDGEQTTAFFLNLWNLMYIHAQLSVWNGSPPLKNSLENLISQSSINYNVGDLGRISMATLRYKLLGSSNNTRGDDANDFFSQTKDINEVAWQDLDLVYDYRVVFAMANEFYETPAIRIYYPTTLDQDLNDAVKNYLASYHKIINIENYKEQQNQDISFASNYLNNKIEGSTSFRKSKQFIEADTKRFDLLLKYEKHDEPRLEESQLSKRTTSRNSSYNNSCTWSSRTVKWNILNHLEGHCWLLSYLVRRLHNESGFDNVQRTASLENISSAPWMTTLAKALFNDNHVLATLSAENLSMDSLWIYLEQRLEEDKFQDCLEVIEALPLKFLMKSRELQCLRDKLLCRLIASMEPSLDAEKLERFIVQIKDVYLLAQTILYNVHKWPVYLSQKALFHAFHHKDKDQLPSHCKLKMNETLCRVTVFRKMLPNYKDEDVNSTGCIVQSLIEGIERLEYQLQPEVQSLVTQELLENLLKNDDADYQNARKILMALPKHQSLKLAKGVLDKLESTRGIKFVLEYILENSATQKAAEAYRKAQVGVEILDQLDAHDRPLYIHLLKEPLLMLEQLLMNCKLKILQSVRNVIQKLNILEKAGISMDSFDEIVRFYAGKSLDFRVSLQRGDGFDSKLRVSQDSAVNSNSEINESIEFTMPPNVPTKEQWVPNDQARVCHSCKVTIFSMFNRRHHCRRCGNVVCSTCSQHRMQVSGYPKSVPVRVCNDCKRQTMQQAQSLQQGAPSIASSVASDYWRLTTTDEAHNTSLRKEFSFEHAPNVSMCLAIMSLHSDHKSYANFLLDHCHEMKRLLRPGPGGRVNPEIDHTLIIKMIKSLLIAVKMKCSKLGMNSGLAHCDQFLSHIQIITILVQSDCLALVPMDDSLDEHALRKLRDLLAEKEQWHLALDVCTKAGMDTQGVWAAWGKACLKAGHMDRARVKFSHCLDKVIYENVEDWVMLSYPSDSEESNCSSSHESVKLQSPKIAKRQNQTKTSQRPAKNPPLLVEILQILENQSQLHPPSSESTVLLQKPNIAQEILTTLNSLKAVSQGQFSLVCDWKSRDVYYKESLHYLLSYGSLTSILEFYIRHDEFDKCCAFVLESNIEPDLFFSAVYMRCLKAGKVQKLLDSMRTENQSLSAYKKYLVHTCFTLDKNNFLHTLYHLQLFMQDRIRAAMTCIRFYTSGALNYVNLSTRSQCLIDAQKHLETVLLNIARGEGGSGPANGGLVMEMEPSEIDKHINTISRQMEIAKFLSVAEKEARPVSAYLKHLMEMEMGDGDAGDNQLPTLFGNQLQKTKLAVLAILCGRDTEEGFGTAFRIMQDYNLRPQKVYSLAGHVLALEKKVGSIEQLIKCCRSSGSPDATSDCVLTHCVRLLLQDPSAEVDSLIRLINDVELKISLYIERKQLKAAYLLAVKHQSAKDIKKIFKEADRLGQNAIKQICGKWLANRK